MVLAVGLPVVMLLAGRMPTVDLAYLVRAGDAMLRSHHVLRTDTFTFTVGGLPWLNQQWGSEVLLAAVFRLGGWPLLMVLRAATGAAVFSLVLMTCRARGASTRQAAWLTLGFSPVALGGLLVRPQMFGLLLFALTMWILANRDRRPRLVFVIPLIVAAWANLHGSFFLGPLLVGLAFLDDLRRKSPGARRLLMLILVCVAAACLGPFGPRVWTYAFDVSTSPVIAAAVVEWQAPSVRDAIGAIFFVSVTAASLILALSPRRLPWTSLLTLAIFLLVGLFAVRGVCWWGIVAPPLLVEALPVRSDAGSPAGDRLANWSIVGLLIALVVAFLPWWRVVGAPSAESALLERAPVGLTKAVSRLAPRGARLFVSQPLSSWFEFAVPRDPVFVDPRLELYPTSIWRQYGDVSTGRADWNSVLEKWHVDVVVADRHDQRDLIPYIQRSPEWRLGYADPDGLVFLRARRSADEQPSSSPPGRPEVSGASAISCSSASLAEARR